ncbi:flagellin [Alkalibaculum bacchi]|uniref:Flagellin n=1 Tax=Alkalibaculum bacchi TaxID=645887 RepID=A0A366IFJ9_9FIRM|nr:flagellin [Alkalibaculum bacchi]RBP70116.1 flagellin [Alkalibaculum bacchi]
MRINNNLSAMNTYSRLTSANTAKSNSLEKLSSGLRINKAGDDAAGLAISEKMRGQIGGLNQAVRNAQDGISLIQTAEGALSETHSILQRMRELSVQSSNDTNTLDDRREIQKEIEQLKSEINRISDSTEFNTQKLLNGSLGAVGTSSDKTIADVTSATGLKVGKYELTVTQEATQSTNTFTAPTDFTALTNDFSINGIKIDLTGVTSATDFADKVNAQTEKTGVSVDNNGEVFTAKAYGSSAEVVIGGTDYTGGTFVAGDNVEVNISDGDMVTEELKGVGQSVIYRGAELEVAGADSDTATINVTKSGAALHIGANKDQNMLIDINEMSTKTLGSSTNKVKDIDVLTQSGANEAIATLDEAIKSVSAERSKLGATQNRLDHTINNLTTTSENLSAAESRIRDVDMAQEMMEFTKNNILSQAATSMLAQANQMPQSVLQLLQ